MTNRMHALAVLAKPNSLQMSSCFHNYFIAASTKRYGTKARRRSLPHMARGFVYSSINDLQLLRNGRSFIVASTVPTLNNYTSNKDSHA